jgi:hypothetical protein
MTQPEEIHVSIRDRDGGSAEGQVKVQKWDKKSRTRRALKVLGACWALSLVCIILPIVHFVLVPGFFLGGIVAAWFISQQESVVLGGEGSCPKCHEKLSIVRSANRWPLTDLCAKCQTPVTVDKKA